LEEVRNSAESIVAVNQSVADYVETKNIIPNCYDTQLAGLWKLPQSREKITIGVFGTINELTPIYPLIDTLKLIKEKEPEIFGRVRVLQVGLADAEFLNDELIKEGLYGVLEFKGYQGRAKAVELLSEAAVFYLGVSHLGKGLTTSRIFTLLSSGRPILAFAEAGSEFERIMLSSSNAYVFDESGIGGAAGFLSKMVREYLRGDLRIEIEPEGVREFSSEKMVEKFCRLLEGDKKRG
jgi:glycosyltransferase involved in cell wall biosynthesis